MKKFFITLTMMLLGLFAGVSTLWAADPNPETDYYWAKLTARPSTGTGGSGKVYVSNTSTIPADGDYQNESSAYSSKDSYVQIDGNVVDFYTYAKADDGSYFVGWSDFNGGTEKAQRVDYNCGYEPSAKRGKSNALEYAIYATFEPIRIGAYTIEGQNTTTSEGEVSLKITVNLEGDEIYKDDFSGGTSASPFVITVTDGTEGVWKKKPTGSFAFGAGNTTAILTVKCVPGTSENKIFTATATLTTKAGVSVDIPLTVRKVEATPGNAVLYDGKTQMKSGTVAEMLAENTSAYANPIIKLSGDYSDAVSINKNITFDLNGYKLSNTLTISGGNVTIAYSAFGGSANALNVTGGKAILNGGTFGTLTIGANATVEQNGATITDAATNNGTLTTTNGEFQAGLTSTKTLIVNGGTFNGATAIQVTGGTAQIKRGTISGST